MGEFIIDFFSHELQPAIEIDGSTHDYNCAYDQNRQEILECSGIRVPGFSDSEIKKNMNDVLRVVESLILRLRNRSDEYSVTTP